MTSATLSVALYSGTGQGWKNTITTIEWLAKHYPLSTGIRLRRTLGSRKL